MKRKREKQMNNYDFKVNLYENMTVTVVAENKEEAKRILNMGN